MNPRINKPQENTENNRKQFGIHGAGNIGLGLLADIISQNGEYHIKGTSSDEFLKNVVNSTHRVSLQHGDNENSKKTVVRDVEIISRESDDIVELYKSNIVAICLTPDALVNSAKDIARGIIKRHEEKHDCLKIFILMNLPECDVFVKEKITSAMQTMGHSISEIEKILSTVQFIETVADRIVKKIDVTKVKKQLRDQLSRVLENPEEIEQILNDHAKLQQAIKRFNLECNLFNAERKFTLHVPNTIPEETNQFPLMTQVNSLKKIREIKNKFINGPHAIIAWLGALMGFSTIADAIKHPDILSYIQTLMLEEIGPALKAEFTDLSNNDLEKQMSEFLKRCTKIQDDTERVGKEPLRKLKEGDRIRGTLRLCKKHDLTRVDTGLEKAYAAALLYAINGKDPTDKQCEKIREVYEQQRKVYQHNQDDAKNHAYEDVICYKDGSYSGLDPKKDEILIKDIVREIGALQRKIDGRDHKMKIVSFFKTNQDKGTHDNHEITSTAVPRHNNIKTVDKLNLTSSKWSFFSQHKVPNDITNNNINAISSHRSLSKK